MNRPVVPQRVQGVGVLVQLEPVRDESRGAGPAAPQRRDRGRERIDLREWPLDRDLATEHIVRQLRDQEYYVRRELLPFLANQYGIQRS